MLASNLRTICSPQPLRVVPIAAPVARPTERREIVFIDAALANYRKLAAGVRAGAEIVILKANRNGVEKITQALKVRQGITTVHLVSPGSAGQIQLGSAVLSLATLERYVWDLVTWADTLAADAELLLYGCEVAAGEQGEALIFQLHQLTGAKIAASKTKTGSAASGGTWKLTVETGDMQATCIFTPEIQTTYGSLLQ